MPIALTGATGFIGARILQLAAAESRPILAFSRHPERKVPCALETRLFSSDTSLDFTDCDAVIHLAGESVAGVWTDSKRNNIVESRRVGTRRVVDSILSMPTPPRVLVSASAIGFYGDTGETITDESAPSGGGFLAETCRLWEQEAARVKEKNVRLVILRTAVVLGPNGGALRAMLPAFRAGLGGTLGAGRQWMSWIHLDDAAALALAAARDDRFQGPLNLCAPEPVRNADFTRALAKALHRPAFFRIPALALRTVLGDFSRELLDSRRIVPKNALSLAYPYRFPALSDALLDLFQKP